MGKPSAAFTHDELCDEFDWMYEFSSRMAERIRNDPDVHNLAAYVEKLERQNKELRELVWGMYGNYSADGVAPIRLLQEYLIRMRELGVEVD